MLLVLQFLFGSVALIYLGMAGADVAPGADRFLTRPWTWSLAAALPWIIIQAVGSILGIGLIFRAYQIGQASYVAVFEYSAFIFGPFFAWLFIGQQIQLLQVAGIACIAAAGVLIARRTL
jgi:drug/metabolite transporter (DMT)-like permease